MTKRTPSKWVLSILLYCIGLLCLAFGVAFSANAGLGISTVNSLPYVIASCLKLDDKVGSVVTAVFCFYILMQFIIKQKEFKFYNVLQILSSYIFGYFVTFSKSIVGSWRILDNYIGSLIMLGFSILLVAFGVFIYVAADVIPIPIEGLTMCIANKTGNPFPKVKTLVDCGIVALGLMLSLIILRSPFKWIREGTIISALLTGKLVAILRKHFGDKISNVLFANKTNAGE